MGFFKKIKRFALPVIGSLLAPGIGTALGSALSAGSLAAIGSAAGSGISNYTSSHNIGQALASGLGSYAGSQFAGNALGGLGSTTLGSTILGAPANALGELALNSLPGAALNTSIGSIIGSSVGSDIASNAFAKEPSAQFASDAGPKPFNPVREEQQALPPSLSGLGSLSLDQQESNLANQGTYGSGLGPQEQSYYLNLVNRRLIDDSGRTGDSSSLRPIEQSYLQRLGFGGYNNTSNLLEAISKWRQQQPAAA